MDTSEDQLQMPVLEAAVGALQVETTRPSLAAADEGGRIASRNRHPDDSLPL